MRNRTRTARAAPVLPQVEVPDEDVLRIMLATRRLAGDGADRAGATLDLAHSIRAVFERQVRIDVKLRSGRPSYIVIQLVRVADGALLTAFELRGPARRSQ